MGSQAEKSTPQLSSSLVVSTLVNGLDQPVVCTISNIFWKDQHQKTSVEISTTTSFHLPTQTVMITPGLAIVCGVRPALRITCSVTESTPTETGMSTGLDPVPAQAPATTLSTDQVPCLRLKFNQSTASSVPSPTSKLTLISTPTANTGCSLMPTPTLTPQTTLS